MARRVRRSTSWWIGGAGASALALAGGLGWALWPEDPGGPRRIDPGDPAQVALGRRVYAQHCASCHGADLEGQPQWRQRRADGRLPAPPHDATGHTWHHPDEQLFQVTKHGVEAFAPPGYRSDMPGFGAELSDAELRAVIAFIKSTWPPEIQARQREISRAARNDR